MKISVIGGGYVGLVSSICFAQLGHSVDLIEIEKDKCDAINAGRPPLYEAGLEDLLSIHAGRRLHAHAEYKNTKNSDLTFICVGTPQSSNGYPNLSPISSACKFLGKSLMDKENGDFHVVVVKSTVPPGTTEKLIMPTVLKYACRGTDEIGFAVNPEFLREGLAIYDFMNPDRIVIGSIEESVGDQVQAVYEGIKAPVVRTGLTTAEMIKYASNAFLAAKISYANEIGNICKMLGVNVYEVMHGVGLDSRIGLEFLKAGAGFGGSCFPKDVMALIALAKDLGEDPILLRSVIEVNERQPIKIVDLLSKRIGDLRGKRIAIIGLSFKENTDDVRESRSITVIKELKRRGATIAAYDPKAISSMKRILPDVDYYSSAAEALAHADACLVMTEWPEFSLLDKEFNLMNRRVIIEARRILCCSDCEGICW